MKRSASPIDFLMPPSKLRRTLRAENILKDELARIGGSLGSLNDIIKALDGHNLVDAYLEADCLLNINSKEKLSPYMYYIIKAFYKVVECVFNETLRYCLAYDPEWKDACHGWGHTCPVEMVSKMKSIFLRVAEDAKRWVVELFEFNFGPRYTPYVFIYSPSERPFDRLNNDIVAIYHEMFSPNEAIYDGLKHFIPSDFACMENSLTLCSKLMCRCPTQLYDPMVPMDYDRVKKLHTICNHLKCTSDLCVNPHPDPKKFTCLANYIIVSNQMPQKPMNPDLGAQELIALIERTFNPMHVQFLPRFYVLRALIQVSTDIVCRKSSFLDREESIVSKLERVVNIEHSSSTSVGYHRFDMKIASECEMRFWSLRHTENFGINSYASWLPMDCAAMLHGLLNTIRIN